MSRIYDNWEKLVREVLKREQFREMALAPPSAESSFRSDSDLSRFASSPNHHDELIGAENNATGATRGIAARAALLFTAPIAYFRKRIEQDPFIDLPDDPFGAKFVVNHFERFSLLELQVATDNFSYINIAGSGGFGKVYKGRLADGALVAVKRIKKKRTQCRELQFQTEVEMSSMAVHRNIQRLRGFCMTPTERILVFPFMVNGSVASCLRERKESQPPLDWPIRKLIALGSARGVAYLHDQCCERIIHRDVKAANIFLNEEFEPVLGDFGLAKLIEHEETHVTTAVVGDFGLAKLMEHEETHVTTAVVGDFGLAKLMEHEETHVTTAVVGDFGLPKLMEHDETYVTTAVRGTIGHIAPEYKTTGKVSEKTDVYGYGVMLLELITGQRAFDLARFANQEDVMLLDWVKGLMREKKLEMLVDTDLKSGGYIEAEVEELIQVSLLCTQDSPKKRLNMSDVVRLLQGDDCLAEMWNEWQKDEMLPQKFNQVYHPNTDWIDTDSSYTIRADELSGPR